MKKLILITAVALLGLVIFSSDKTNSLIVKKENMKTTHKAYSLPQNVILFPQKLKALVPTEYDELEKKYQRLSVKEIKREITKLDKAVENNHLIELANSQELNESQRTELMGYMRSKAVLTMLLMDLEVEEL